MVYVTGCYGGEDMLLRMVLKYWKIFVALVPMCLDDSCDSTNCDVSCYFSIRWRRKMLMVGLLLERAFVCTR